MIKLLLTSVALSFGFAVCALTASLAGEIHDWVVALLMVWYLAASLAFAAIIYRQRRKQISIVNIWPDNDRQSNFGPSS